MRFIGYNTCNRLIWTNGIDGSRKQTLPMSHNTQRCLGFINKVHIDKCDIVKEQDTEKWFTIIKSNIVNKNQLQNKNYVISKLKLVAKLFGIFLLTACGY